MEERLGEQGEAEQQPKETPMADLPAIQKVALFNPRTAPVRGMFSFMHPMGLPDGGFSLIQGMRYSDGTFMARRGIVELDQSSTDGLRTSSLLGGSAAVTGTGTTPSSGVFRGATYWNGAFYAAYLVSSAIRIYRSTDLAVWKEITLGSGARNGNNGSSSTTPGAVSRMMDYGSNYIFFHPVVSDFYIPPNAGTSFDGVSGVDTGRELLIASIGANTTEATSNYPYIINGQTVASPETDTTLTRIGIHQDIDPPAYQSSLRSWLTFPVYCNVRGAAGGDVANSGANLVMTAPATDVIKITIGTATAVNDTSTWTPAEVFTRALKDDEEGGSSPTYPTYMDLSNSLQLVLATSTDLTTVWDQFKIELIDTNGATAVLYDPRYGKYERIEWDFTSGATADPLNEQPYIDRVPEVTSATQMSLVAFPLGQLTKPSDAFVMTIDKIKFTFIQGDPPGSSKFLDICVCAGSGQFTGLGQFGVSYFNTTGQCESRGFVLPIGGVDTVYNLGGPDPANDVRGFLRLPELPTVYYTPRIPIRVCSLTERDRGVDTMMFYRKEWGSDRFYQLGSSNGYTTFARFNKPTDVPASTWVWGTDFYKTSATTEDINFTRYRTYSYDLGLNLNRELPDSSFHKVIQPFTCADSASNRYFFGSNNKVQISEAFHPFRHRELVKVTSGIPDIRSASERKFDGQTIKRIESVASSIFGANQAFVWTDIGSYSLDAGDPRQGTSLINQVGMASRDSYAGFKNQMWFLDDQRQFRYWAGGQSNEVSRNTVEDWFQSPNTIWDATTRGISTTRVSKSCSVWHGDRLYVAITPYGGSYNTVVMVYDARTGGWSVDQGLPSEFSCEQWVLYNDTGLGRKRLIAFGNNGRVFEYDAPDDYLSGSGRTTGYDFIGGGATSNTRTSVAIAVKFITQEYHSMAWNPMRFARMGIVSDAIAATTLTITRTVRSGSGSTSSTLSIAAHPNGGVWAYSPVGSAARGVGCRWELSGSVASGWRVMSLIGEMEVSGGYGPNGT